MSRTKENTDKTIINTFVTFSHQWGTEIETDTKTETKADTKTNTKQGKNVTREFHTTLRSRALLVISVLVCGSNGPTFNSRSASLYPGV